jgi:uncharacterized membrane protein YdfJ with MMPL/SSD domain
VRLWSLTFAVTMACMPGHGRRVLALMGSTIAIGLPLDALTLRSLLMFRSPTPLGR